MSERQGNNLFEMVITYFSQIPLDAATKGFTSVDKIGNLKIYGHLPCTVFFKSNLHKRHQTAAVCPAMGWKMTLLSSHLLWTVGVRTGWSCAVATDPVMARWPLLETSLWLCYLKSVTICNWPLENKSKFPQDEEWELNSMLYKSAHTPCSVMLSPQAGRVAMETETSPLWIKCVVKMAVSNLHNWFHLDHTLVPLFALSFLVCSRTPF